MTQTTQLAEQRKVSLVDKFAGKFGVDPKKMMTTLKATAFKQRDGSVPTNEQMMALLVVADQYGLNPWTKEVYAFPDKANGIIPVVGVDGWSRIINTNKDFNGLEFRYSTETIDTLEGQSHAAPEWCECVIYRKDRDHPIVVREYLDEVYRPPMGKYKTKGPWQSHTRRFLRHKTMIQGARLAFGFVGIYDQDEAERIIEAEVVEVVHEYEAAQLPELPADQFAKDLPDWRGLIDSGKKTAEQVTAMVSSKYQLTEDQIATIKANPETGEVVEDEWEAAYDNTVAGGQQ